MSDSIYNNAGMPSEQGAAPEVPIEPRNCCICGAMLLDGKCMSCGHQQCPECDLYVKPPSIAALTLERDTLNAERDDALRKSSRGVWRCFHCDEIFDTPGGARDHFGAAQGDTPGCLLKVQLGDERGWLMELRKEQEANEQQLQRALNAEREVETLECRVASLSSDMKTIKPFAKCDSMRDVFNVYDSMEGRALAAEEQVGTLKAKVERLSAPVSDDTHFHFEDDEVLGALNGSAYVSMQVRNMLSQRMTGEKCELYRAIVKLALAARSSSPPIHPINDDDQRRKDAGWNDRPKARCVCGEMIAWYSGEYLHVASRSGLCADGRLASPAHFLVGMPPAEPEWKRGKP